VARLKSPSARRSQPARKVGQEPRVEVEVHRVDVKEDRARADACDGPAGREERVRARDDLVAGPDSVSHECDEERIGARGKADAMLRAAVGGDLGLECAHLGTQDEHLRRRDLEHRGVELGLQRAVLRLEVEQRHSHAPPRVRHAQSVRPWRP
jgi:hypothetical protein